MPILPTTNINFNYCTLEVIIYLVFGFLFEKKKIMNQQTDRQKKKFTTEQNLCFWPNVLYLCNLIMNSIIWF